MPTSGPLLNWYYGTYVTFFEQYSKKPGFAEFTGLKGRKIFFSTSLGAPPQKFEQWWRGVGAFEAAAGASATPIGPLYNGNELHLSYTTSRPGYLIFVDNHDPYWYARVNGKPVQIKRAFGTFKAVAVPAGKGTVMFKYAPFPYYKRFMALGVLIVIAIVAFEIRRRRRDAASHSPDDVDALTPITTSS
jgi:hypothetical protein